MRSLQCEMAVTVYQLSRNNRSSFQGMIHDKSASGNTLFIEPMSVVTLNNELKELEGKKTV